MNRSKVTLGMLVAVLEGVTLVTWATNVASGTPPVAGKYRGVALAVTLLFPLLLLAFSWKLKLDGFALGSAVFAVLLETVLFVGWLGSPQGETIRFFLIGSALPLILLVVTWLFHYLQREA